MPDLQLQVDANAATKGDLLLHYGTANVSDTVGRLGIGADQQPAGDHLKNFFAKQNQGRFENPSFARLYNPHTGQWVIARLARTADDAGHVLTLYRPNDTGGNNYTLNTEQFTIPDDLHSNRAANIQYQDLGISHIIEADKTAALVAWSTYNQDPTQPVPTRTQLTTITTSNPHIYKSHSNPDVQIVFDNVANTARLYHQHNRGNQGNFPYQLFTNDQGKRILVNKNQHGIFVRELPRDHNPEQMDLRTLRTWYRANGQLNQQRIDNARNLAQFQQLVPTRPHYVWTDHTDPTQAEVKVIVAHDGKVTITKPDGRGGSTTVEPKELDKGEYNLRLYNQELQCWQQVRYVANPLAQQQHLTVISQQPGGNWVSQQAAVDVANGTMPQLATAVPVNSHKAISDAEAKLTTIFSHRTYQIKIGPNNQLYFRNKSALNKNWQAIPSDLTVNDANQAITTGNPFFIDGKPVELVLAANGSSLTINKPRQANADTVVDTTVYPLNNGIVNWHGARTTTAPAPQAQLARYQRWLAPRQTPVPNGLAVGHAHTLENATVGGVPNFTFTVNNGLLNNVSVTTPANTGNLFQQHFQAHDGSTKFPDTNIGGFYLRDQVSGELFFVEYQPATNTPNATLTISSIERQLDGSYSRKDTTYTLADGADAASKTITGQRPYSQPLAPANHLPRTINFAGLPRENFQLVTREGAPFLHLGPGGVLQPWSSSQPNLSNNFANHPAPQVYRVYAADDQNHDYPMYFVVTPNAGHANGFNAYIGYVREMAQGDHELYGVEVNLRQNVDQTYTVTGYTPIPQGQTINVPGRLYTNPTAAVPIPALSSQLKFGLAADAPDDQRLIIDLNADSKPTAAKLLTNLADTNPDPLVAFRDRAGGDDFFTAYDQAGKPCIVQVDNASEPDFSILTVYTPERRIDAVGGGIQLQRQRYKIHHTNPSQNRHESLGAQAIKDAGKNAMLDNWLHVNVERRPSITPANNDLAMVARPELVKEYTIAAANPAQYQRNLKIHFYDDGHVKFNSSNTLFGRRLSGVKFVTSSRPNNLILVNKQTNGIFSVRELVLNDPDTMRFEVVETEYDRTGRPTHQHPRRQATLYEIKAFGIKKPQYAWADHPDPNQAKLKVDIAENGTFSLTTADGHKLPPKDIPLGVHNFVVFNYETQQHEHIRYEARAFGDHRLTVTTIGADGQAQQTLQGDINPTDGKLRGPLAPVANQVISDKQVSDAMFAMTSHYLGDPGNVQVKIGPDGSIGVSTTNGARFGLLDRSNDTHKNAINTAGTIYWRNGKPFELEIKEINGQDTLLVRKPFKAGDAIKLETTTYPIKADGKVDWRQATTATAAVNNPADINKYTDIIKPKPVALTYSGNRMNLRASATEHTGVSLVFELGTDSGQLSRHRNIDFSQLQNNVYQQLNDKPDPFPTGTSKKERLNLYNVDERRWYRVTYQTPKSGETSSSIIVERPELQTNGKYRWVGYTYYLDIRQPNRGDQRTQAIQQQTSRTIKGRLAYVGPELSAADLEKEIEAGRLDDPNKVTNFERGFPTTNLQLVTAGNPPTPFASLDAQGLLTLGANPTPNSSDFLPDGVEPPIVHTVFDITDTKYERPLFVVVERDADAPGGFKLSVGNINKEEKVEQPPQPMFPGMPTPEPTKTTVYALTGAQIALAQQPDTGRFKVNEYDPLKDALVLKDGGKYLKAAETAKDDAAKAAKKAQDGLEKSNNSNLNFAKPLLAKLGWTKDSKTRLFTKATKDTTIAIRENGQGVDFVSNSKDGPGADAVKEAVTLMLRAGVAMPLKATGKHRAAIEDHAIKFLNSQEGKKLLEETKHFKQDGKTAVDGAELFKKSTTRTVRGNELGSQCRTQAQPPVQPPPPRMLIK